MNDQPTPPMPDAEGTLPPPAPLTPPLHADPVGADPQPSPRSGHGRTRQVAAIAAVAAGVAITAGIAVAARDDAATAGSDTATTSDTTDALADALPDLGTAADDDVMPAFGDMPAPGDLPDDAMAFPGGGRHGGERGEFGRPGERGEVPTFDQSGDASAAMPGQMPQGGAPDAASQGS